MAELLELWFELGVKLVVVASRSELGLGLGLGLLAVLLGLNHLM